MDITPLVRSDLQIVQAYKNGCFRISGSLYQGNILILKNEVLSWDAPQDFSSVTADHFSPLAEKADEIDVFLLGTGGQMHFFRPDLREALKEKGLIADVMETGAACRTYNVLAAEGRRVAVALLST